MSPFRSPSVAPSFVLRSLAVIHSRNESAWAQACRECIRDQLTAISTTADGVQTAVRFEPVTADPMSRFYSDSDVELTFTDPMRELVYRASVLIMIEQATVANANRCSELLCDEAIPF
jgi:hypothetical protein